MERSLYKYLVAVAYACFLFPIFNFLVSAMWGPTTTLQYTGLLAVVIASLVCMQITYALGERGANRLIQIGLAIGVSVVLELVLMFGLGQTSFIGGLLAMFVLNMFCSLNGMKACYADVSEIMPRKKVMKYTVLTVIIIFLSGILGCTVAMREIMIVFIIGFILGLFVMNRGLLESLYYMKASQKGMVNKVIQRHNLKLISGLSVAFVAIYLLNYVLTWGFNLAFGGLIQRLIKSIDSGTGGSGTTVDVLTTAPPDDFDPNDRPPAQDNPLGPLINKIAMTVAIVVGVIILFFVIRTLIKHGPSKLRSMISSIGTFFKRLVGNDGNRVKATKHDFVDQVESVKKEDKAAAQKLKILKNQKKVRAIADPVERMRAFYAYFMNVLKKKKLELAASDTTYKIKNKSTLVYDNAEHTKFITEVYNKVRYDDNVPDAGTLDQMDQVLEDISKNARELKTEEDKKDKKKGK